MGPVSGGGTSSVVVVVSAVATGGVTSTGAALGGGGTGVAHPPSTTTPISRAFDNAMGGIVSRTRWASFCLPGQRSAASLQLRGSDEGGAGCSSARTFAMSVSRGSWLLEEGAALRKIAEDRDCVSRA